MPDFSFSPIDDDLCLRIGRIVARWPMVEKFVSLLLGTIMFADQAAMSVVSNGVSMSTQTKWIRALLKSHEHEADNNALVVELLRRADELREERNEFVHGIWDFTGCEPHTAIVETAVLDRIEIIRSRLVTTHDLDDLLSEIDAWLADYVSLGRKLGFPRHRGQTISMFAD